ncbi:Lactoylglutathione lyase [hydrothermal vent metagenome]|uniref:Lactoylglutathione lyase n=1 Tax=hydrothermal vent metagenome TaxID=652676 RepID=A0A3B0XCN3_9ZZZZ
MDTAIDFYTNVFDMKLLRRKDYPEGILTLAFVGYGDEKEIPCLNLDYAVERLKMK